MTSQPDDVAINSSEDASGNAGAKPFSVGSALREARTLIGLSVGEVSGRIKFAPRQIEALEADDFAQLPEAAFVRGFVRSYARLVQLDPEILLASLPQALVQPVPVAANTLEEIPFPDVYSARKPNIIWLVAALVVAVVLVLFIWLRGSVTNAPHETQVKVEEVELPSLQLAATPQSAVGLPEATLPAPALPAAAQLASAEHSTVLKGGAQVAAPAVPPVTVPVVQPAAVPVVPPVVRTVAPPVMVQPAKPVAVPAAKPVVAPSAKPASENSAAQQTAAIHMTFDQESWVEVKDKNGQVLMAQLNPQGTERYVRGEPPFTLLVGNSGGVRLTYKGKPIDLAPHSSAQVAHLTLE